MVIQKYGHIGDHLTSFATSLLWWPCVWNCYRNSGAPDQCTVTKNLSEIWRIVEDSARTGASKDCPPCLLQNSSHGGGSYQNIMGTQINFGMGRYTFKHVFCPPAIAIYLPNFRLNIYSLVRLSLRVKGFGWLIWFLVNAIKKWGEGPFPLK